MWGGQDPNVITQQPGYNPQFQPGGYAPQQQFPMGQFPQQPMAGGGFPPPQGPYGPPQNPYGQMPPPAGGMYPGPYGPQQPMMQQPQGGGGMLDQVKGMVNQVVDVNPMNQMHSAGNIITGYRAPPVMPLGPVQGCPLGLEHLLGTEHLVVQQQIEKMEALLEQVGVPIETPNRYDVLNSAGNRIYFAAETGGLLGMQFSPSGSTRPFKIVVVDFSGRPVLNIERKWNCLYCCLSTCNCCGSTGTAATVALADGTYLGKIVQKFNWCTPFLFVEDDAGNRVAQIKGSTCQDCCCSCTGQCCCDTHFELKTTDGDYIGKITKKFSGIVQEQFTDADNFGVSFPRDMEVRAKAMLLGAVFLLDFMFFESQPEFKRD